jgi:predicted membrane protein
MTMLGIGFFAVVLAGPLADLRSPHKAYLIFTSPHITPSATNPGISLIAFQAFAWLIALILSIVFALLTFSYYAHQASLMSTGVRKTIYQAFSLGVKTPEKYRRAEMVAKGVAMVMIPFLTLWGIYPASLFVAQTWNPVWRNWTLLPVIYFAEAFVAATALFLLAYFFWRFKEMESDVIVPVLKIHEAGCLSLAALTGLQMAVWWFWSPMTAEMVSPLTPLMYAVIALMFLAYLLSLIARRYPAAVLAVALVSIVGSFANKWNIIINGQLISKTGLAFFKAELGGLWFLETAAPIALGVAVSFLLSLVFPLEVREVGK